MDREAIPFRDQVLVDSCLHGAYHNYSRASSAAARQRFEVKCVSLRIEAAAPHHTALSGTRFGDGGRSLQYQASLGH
jgi:hypothetical protein